MKTILIDAGRIYADYRMTSQGIEVVRVFRGEHTFTDPAYVAYAQRRIPMILNGTIRVSVPKGY